ncbi:MAG TPA: ATP synthase F0 subunit C [Planctomycetota bacterium]|nr:ATP synthase F0 subunit C [Planctomycetota bacterium]
MLKKGLAVAAILAILGMPAFAFEAAVKETKATAEGKDPGTTGSSHSLGQALGFGLAIAAFGGAISQSNAIAKSVDAVARQPEAGARIQGMMIIGLALIETLVIYMLLICFMWGSKIV